MSSKSVRFVILHYHILKNAGSTIEDILDRSFGDRFARMEAPERDAVITPGSLSAFVAERPGLVAVSSHHTRYPLPEVPGTLFFDICFLRDPIDRVRSMYDYFRARPAEGDPVSDLANSSTIGSFVKGMVEKFALQIRDVQVNLIAAAGDSDEPTREHLEIAVERMMKCSFLGVVDCFDESVAAGQYFLGHVFPRLDCAIAPVNVTGGLHSTVASRIEKLRSACDPEIFERLLRMNALDFELVERARGEVRRRFSMVPRRLERVSEARRIDRRAAPPVSPAKALIRIVRALPYLGAFRTCLFDADYYRACNPEAGNPLFHFITRGAFAGRDPHPLFDTAFYLRNNPGLAARNINPLGHYLKHGANGGLQPHPLFDAGFYLARNRDVSKAGINPLVHYVRHGSLEDRKPHALFQPEYYLEQCANAGRGNGNPLVHFLEADIAQLCNPHRLFDCEAYLREHPDLVIGGANPLVHYLQTEAARARSDFAGIEIDDVKLNEARAPAFIQSLNPDQVFANANYKNS